MGMNLKGLFYLFIMKGALNPFKLVKYSRSFPVIINNFTQFKLMKNNEKFFRKIYKILVMCSNISRSTHLKEKQREKCQYEILQ